MVGPIAINASKQSQPSTSSYIRVYNINVKGNWEQAMVVENVQVFLMKEIDDGMNERWDETSSR